MRQHYWRVVGLLIIGNGDGLAYVNDFGAHDDLPRRRPHKINTAEKFLAHRSRCNICYYCSPILISAAAPMPIGRLKMPPR